MWIVAVFLFDLVLVGALILAPDKIPAPLFGFLMLLNPTDVFRLVCFAWLGGATQSMGLATVSAGPPVGVLLGALAAWTIVPLLCSQLLFQRRVALDRLL